MCPSVKIEANSPDNRVSIYDTTLRDGAQREGISFSVEDKLRITARLDALGVHYIEGGYPGANPKDDEFFSRVSGLGLVTAKIVAFGGIAREVGVSPCEDPNLAPLANSGCDTISLYGKAWKKQLEDTMGISAEKNLERIAWSITSLKKLGREVFFLVEHFFDGHRDDPDYAEMVCAAAVQAGADVLVLCDTNGGSLPGEIFATTNLIREMLPKARIGIHTHNDTGCAVANSLVAVEAGATQVQGTINGYGERAGNADLVAIIASLELKMGRNAIGRDNLAKLADTSHFVAEVANVAPDPYQPYVGASVFTHKAGVHASGMARAPKAYEHIDPSSVGNLARIVVSELAGRASLIAKAQELGHDLDPSDPKVGEIVRDIKRLEHEGYSFEVADGSLELLIRDHLNQREEHFRLESFRVIADKHEDGRVVTEATIKVHVGEERFVATAEGNGPVNALDKALRLAITQFYPQLNGVELTDYKVRVLDESIGTDAVTRVLIESTNGESSWGTVGVSENIIEASWAALVDSIEYALSHTND